MWKQRKTLSEKKKICRNNALDQPASYPPYISISVPLAGRRTYYIYFFRPCVNETPRCDHWAVINVRIARQIYCIVLKRLPEQTADSLEKGEEKEKSCNVNRQLARIQSVVFTNKVGKNSRYFVGVSNKTIIPLALVGYEIIIPNSALRLVRCLPYHIQHALVE